MNNSEDSEEGQGVDKVDILIYIQKRLTKLEKECATSLLIIRDLQKQLRSNTLVYHNTVGPLLKEEIHNISIPPEKVTKLTTLEIPESGLYVVSVNIQLHSYKCVKFQHISLNGAICASNYNEPDTLSNQLKTADKSLHINKTVELQKGDTIDLEFYHLSSNSKKIIRSVIEATLLKK
jgi:hypothetical protein